MEAMATGLLNTGVKKDSEIMAMLMSDDPAVQAKFESMMSIDDRRPTTDEWIPDKISLSKETIYSEKDPLIEVARSQNVLLTLVSNGHVTGAVRADILSVALRTGFGGANSGSICSWHQATSRVNDRMSPHITLDMSDRNLIYTPDQVPIYTAKRGGRDGADVRYMKNLIETADLRQIMDGLKTPEELMMKRMLEMSVNYSGTAEMESYLGYVGAVFLAAMRVGLKVECAFFEKKLCYILQFALLKLLFVKIKLAKMNTVSSLLAKIVMIWILAILSTFGT